MHTEPSLDGRRVIVLLAGACPRAKRRRRARRVWLSCGCLSVRHRLGPDGGDGASGTGLMDPRRVGAEAPGRGERPGLRTEADLGLNDGVRVAHWRGEKGAGPRQA